MASMVARAMVFRSAESSGLKVRLRIVWQTSRLIADGSVRIGASRSRQIDAVRIEKMLWLPPERTGSGSTMAQVIGRALHGRVD